MKVFFHPKNAEPCSIRKISPLPLSSKLYIASSSPWHSPLLSSPISAAYARMLIYLLDAESITRVAAGRLADADNLDDLPAPEAEVPGDGVLLEDARQLRLLEAVALEQGNLLVARQQDVAGHELVVGDVDEEVVLEEALNLGEVLDRGERLAGGGGEGHVGDHDARLVVVGDGVLGKLADLGHAKLLVGEELDPDGAAVGGRVRVGVGGGRGVLAHHRVGRAGGELKLAAAGRKSC